MGMYDAAQHASRGKDLGKGTEHHEDKDKKGPSTEKGASPEGKDPGHAGNVELHAHLANHHRVREAHHDQVSKLHAQLADAHAAHSDHHASEAEWHEARC